MTTIAIINRKSSRKPSSWKGNRTDIPAIDSEFEIEIPGLKNYEFPCVGEWDKFHVQVSRKLKSVYSFKKMYTVNNLGLVGLLATINYYCVELFVLLVEHMKQYY